MNSVMIRWTAPPGALVTGYIVRYRLASGNGGDGTMTVSQDSTNTETNYLTVGETYTFTVETTASNMLPGVSVGVSITVGEWHINYSSFISSLSHCRATRASWGRGGCCRIISSHSILESSGVC